MTAREDRDRETVKNWPKTREEFDRHSAAAKAKYQPLVNNLTAPEVYGLGEAVTDRIEHLNRLINADPGTHI